MAVEVKDKAIEVLQLARQLSGSKRQLLARINEEFSLGLPLGLTYNGLAERLAKSNLEEAFCRSFFNLTSYDEVWSKNVMVQGLALLSSKEVAAVAKFLSQNSTKWTYDKKSTSDMLAKLVANVSLHDLNECLSELILDDQVDMSVRQHRRLVVGPLGFTISVQSRKGGMTWALKRFIEEKIHGSLVVQFMHEAKWIPTDFALSSFVNREYRQQELIQLAFSYGRDTEIFSTINRLIEVGILNIEDVRMYYWGIVGTPCGVFEREYGGVESLANLLVEECNTNHLRQQLKQKKCFSDDVLLGAIQMCVRESPTVIINEFFSWGQLLTLAQSFGLVRAEKVPKSELADIIAVRLGFDLPPPLEGLKFFTELVTNSIIGLEQVGLSSEQLDGIMTRAYRATESILKDLVYFYVSFLWEQEFSFYDEPGEIQQAFNEFCKKQFRIERGVEVLTLGQLIELLRMINKMVQDNLNLKEKLQQQFSRKIVITTRLMISLEEAIGLRKHVTHDKKKGIRQVTTTVGESRKSLDKLLDFAHDLGQSHIYPYIFRLQREVTDEYGRRYAEVIDDRGQSWLIRSDHHLEPSEPYLMHSFTSPIAVKPFIIRKVF